MLTLLSLSTQHIIIIGIFLFLLLYGKSFLKKMKRADEKVIKNEPEKAISVEPSEQNDLPNICPNCKNPNTRKSRECEWCGNQII